MGGGSDEGVPWELGKASLRRSISSGILSEPVQFRAKAGLRSKAGLGLNPHQPLSNVSPCSSLVNGKTRPNEGKVR